MINVGDKAPEILGINEKGEEIRLSDYKGKKIVLYFYPKDSTSGCTAQACNLRDNYTDLRKAGYEVIGVSVDNEKSHQKFIEKNNGNGGMHHLAFAVEDGVAGALAEVEEKGIRLIDKAPRKGAEGLNIAFLHPKSTLGVLTELCEH